MSKLDHFDKLVIHASKERWCYKLGCTTCGSMEFRNGMEVVGEGKNPIKRVDDLAHMRLMWLDEPDTVAERNLTLAGQAINANISRYYHDCHEYNWLGFMGLVLNKFENCRTRSRGDYREDLHTENCELILKLISNSWSEKFFELFQEIATDPTSTGGSRPIEMAMAVCKKIMYRDRERFQVQDLESMERAFIALRQSNNSQRI